MPETKEFTVDGYTVTVSKGFESDHSAPFYIKLAARFTEEIEIVVTGHSKTEQARDHNFDVTDQDAAVQFMAIATAALEEAGIVIDKEDEV